MPDWDTMITEFEAKEAKRINDALAPKPSTFGRIASIIGSRETLAFYLGFFTGCFATVISAAIWSTMP